MSSNNIYGNPIQIEQKGQTQDIMENQVQPIIKDKLNYNKKLGSIPMFMICPKCNVPIITNVEISFNIFSCILCFISSGWLWMLYQICRGKEIGCMDAIHICPNCGKLAAKYDSCL